MLNVRHKINPDGTITVKVGQHSTKLRSSADIAAFTAGFKVGVIAANRAMTDALKAFDTVVAEVYPDTDAPEQGSHTGEGEPR